MALSQETVIMLLFSITKQKCLLAAHLLWYDTNNHTESGKSSLDHVFMQEFLQIIFS